MDIAITTNAAFSLPRDLGAGILGAGGQIQIHGLAASLAKRGHSVSVIQGESGNDMGEVDYIAFTDKDAQRTFDAVIGFCVPSSAFAVKAKRRYVSVQCDNHWLPPNEKDFFGLDKIVLCGECLYKHYAKTINSTRLAQIGNGFDADYCYPVETRRNRLGICFSAVIIEGTGLHLALEALSLVNHPRITFTVYGSSKMWGGDVSDGRLTESDEYESRLRGLLDSVQFPVDIRGAIPYHQMLSEYTNHSILIHPKTFETFGCSLVEAMAAGVIPVASPYHACLDRLNDGIRGFNCTTAAEYAGAISVLLESDLETSTHRAECIKYAKSFTFDAIAHRWEALLNVTA